MTTPRGRPRRFDVDTVLDAAVDLFWEHGYEGTSMSDVVAATRVQRGSLYAAFGDKPALFDRVLAHYQATISGFVARALAASTAPDVIETVLRGIVDVATGEAVAGRRTPRGCLFVHGALGTSADAEAVRADLARRRAAGEAALARRFGELAEAGDPVAAAQDPQLLARWLVATRYGLAVQARSGADRAQLHAVVDLVLTGPPLAPSAGGAPTTAPGPPEGPGTVDDCRGLHDDVVERFTSRWVDGDGVRLHAVVGGSGPPVLLLCGWPQTWFAWRLVMTRLAAAHRVVALDPRGVGRSEMPAEGYDTGTLAADALAAMRALGHARFAVVGHDVGMWVGYALAADAPGRVTRLAVADAVVPGLAPPIPLFADQEVVERLWHFGFNRIGGLNEDLVAGRERRFLAHQFSTKAARPLAPEAVDVYVRAVSASSGALRASFGPYRALDRTMAQNARRREHRLAVPVLTLAGGSGSGELVEQCMRGVAPDLEAVVLPDCGHYVAEEAPDRTAAALLRFLAHDRPDEHDDPHAVGGRP